MAVQTEYLPFAVSGEGFALPAERAHELLEAHALRRMTNAPGYVRGLIDYSARRLVVLDLGVMFGGAPNALTERSRVIVVDTTVDGRRAPLGLLVDRVFAVTRFDGGALSPTPSLGDHLRIDFITGVGRKAKRSFLALDLDRLLEEEPRRAAA